MLQDLFYFKAEQFGQFLDAVDGQFLRQIFSWHEKCSDRKMKMRENDTHFLGFLLDIFMFEIQNLDCFACLLYFNHICIKLKLSDSVLLTIRKVVTLKCFRSRFRNFRGGGYTLKLIKSKVYIRMLQHLFHMKAEQFRQFLEAMDGQFLKQIFSLHEKCSDRKMKMQENDAHF